MYYVILVLAVITVINTIWTLLDHKGMSTGKIVISCLARIQFIVLVVIITIFDFDAISIKAIRGFLGNLKGR